MALYAIGDIQGCYDELQQLLQKLHFDPRQDQLWFTGDLVNRGPQSLAVLRLVKQLGASAVTVLGNHDLHLLAVAHGASNLKKHDTFQDVLQAPDRDVLLQWLSMQPLMQWHEELDIAMVHAGLAPQWTLENAKRYAQEVEQVLRSEKCTDFFHHMYGNEPKQWRNDLSGWERLRFITNTFTRLRYCDAQGVQALDPKGPPGTQPEPYLPWYEVPGRASVDHTIVFGHWAALGLQNRDNIIALDSGCAWGGALSAVRLDTDKREFISVPCQACAEM